MTRREHNGAHLHITQTASERIETLQAIWAIAAFMVVLFHAGHAADKHGGSMPFVGLTGLGEFGVDMFFVLSGFIILHVTVGRGRSWADYALARFRRIFLPYWPVGIAMAAMILGLDAWGDLRGWLISLTLLPVGQPALNVARTLQHELIF